jgi:endonuclease/exonuclease/phosphatase family metal-dependent hydrolase
MPMVVFGYFPALVRMAASALWELVAAPRDLLAGVRAGEDRASEVKFVVSRTAVGVVLRELSVLGMSVGLARGLPIVHGNFLGYDENAHRRGPDSRLALRALRATDGAVARLWRAAHRSVGRAYDVWIISDHGQESTDSYVALHGEAVATAVQRIAVELGIVDPELAGLTDAPAVGVGHQRARQLGERIIARIVPGLDVSDIRHADGALTVTAQGPLGHVYTPRTLPEPEADKFARAIVERAGVPLVLRRGEGDDAAVAHTTAGRFVLPADAGPVLGAEHPYRDQVAADLVALCHHADAGDLVISGWRPDGRSLSFPLEHGAHAGPGPNETDAFALVPPDTPLAGLGRTASVVRPRDLRRAGFALLDGTRHRQPLRRTRHGVRILTYNVHSCIGLDRRLSPERIARVIARHAPDIVALQEIDVGRSRTGHLDQARAIADALEMTLEFHPTVSVADEQFGDAVLSPHPLRRVHAGPLPGIGLEPRGAIWVEVDVPDDGEGATRAVQLINTHLSLHPRERAMATSALLGPDWLGHPLAQHDIVLCGDFNALSWFPSLRRLGRRLTDAQTGLDGHRPRRTWFGRFPIGRIDHVLIDPDWTVTHVEVPNDTRARIASDHRPVVVDIQPPVNAATATDRSTRSH